MLPILILTVLTVVLLAILYVNQSYSYWKRHGVLQIEPSFPFGNMKELLLKKKTFGQTFKDIYDYFKNQKQAFGGYYFVLKPEIIMIDTELIKCALAKDFSYFCDRGTYLDEKNDPLSAHLFALPGTKWRPLRAKLTPTFTSGKMKQMFPILTACSNELKQLLVQTSSSLEPIDIKEILSRFTIDVIGSCAFGIECNSLKNPDNEFRKYSMQVLEVKGIDSFRQMLAIAIPNIMSFLGIPGMNPKCTNFFLNVVKQTVNYRETNQIVRNDFLQLLIELKKSSDLSLEQIAAQCFVFFLAGFETSSTTMTLCLFELAYNEDLQNKVRDEISKVLKKYDNVLSYEALMEMNYLDKCVSETLRKYPPLPFLNREVTSAYEVPGTKCTLEKGTPIVIALEGIHWDPEFYPEPEKLAEKFDPERFNEEEKSKRPQYSYLPFGEGPRICIGLRFGLMQTKVGLVEILRSFKCRVNEKTKVPLVMTPKTFLTAVEGGVWLNMEKIL